MGFLEFVRTFHGHGHGHGHGKMGMDMDKIWQNLRARSVQPKSNHDVHLQNFIPPWLVNIPSNENLAVSMIRFPRAAVVRGLAHRGFQNYRAQPGASQRYSTADTHSTGGQEDPFSYCREFVKKHDRDSYLTSLFFPKDLQGFCFAVRSFYVSNVYHTLSVSILRHLQIELAMIQDSVTNVIIGEMRMQFWKDAVKSISEAST